MKQGVSATVTPQQLRQAIRALELHGAPVCLHSSLRSFGQVEGGARSIVDAFLLEGCTVLVPSFTYEYGTSPPEGVRPERNGTDYSDGWSAPRDAKLFKVAENDLSLRPMGAIPQAVLQHPDRIRGHHSLNSFAAIGPLSRSLVAGQQLMDVYSPLRALVEMDGFVALLGVGLTSMTILHLAEQAAGRNLFIRWAIDECRNPIPMQIGTCSDGFGRFEQAVEPLERALLVGSSRWRVFPAADLVQAASQAIREKPDITACNDSNCMRCAHAIQGGPNPPISKCK
ncbi:MAG: AAC(3) family N-acetyltransferase [Chloroflexota bacterium]